MDEKNFEKSSSENVKQTETKKSGEDEKPKKSPKHSRRPLSTKSRHGDSNRAKKSADVGKKSVKRRNSLTDFYKKKSAFDVNIKKKSLKDERSIPEQETGQDRQAVWENPTEKYPDDSMGDNFNGKKQDQSTRPFSSSGRQSDRSNGHGNTGATSDNRSTKIKSFVKEDTKSKTFGFKKTWQRIKSAKVADRRPQSSNGNINTELPSKNSSDPEIKQTSQNENKIPTDMTDKHITTSAGNTAVQENTESLIPSESARIRLDSVSQVSVEPPAPYQTVKYPEEEKLKSVVSNSDSWIHSAIPYLPLGLSIFCLLLNIFIPGSGTILSGFSILMCGEARIQTKEDQVTVTLCVNIWVGVSQLFTVTFLFVGWFWSLAWGIKLVSLSVEYKRQKRQKRERELQVIALNAFGSSMQMRPVFSVVTE